jgi:predicted DCC family thiol-disulfide oxidoreductase YuxK
MISLSSEMTDAKGRQASRGWIFFDRECSVCISLARRFRPAFEKRGFGIAALQDTRAASLLGLPPDKLLLEMRVVTTDGQGFPVSRAAGVVDVAALRRSQIARSAAHSGRLLSLVRESPAMRFR